MANLTQRATQQTTSATNPDAPQDVWTHGAEQSLAYLTKYKNALLGGCVALVLLVAGTALVLARQRSETQAASVAFAKALALLDRPSDEERTKLHAAREARDVELAQLEKDEAALEAKPEAAKAAGEAKDTDADADLADADAPVVKKTAAERRAALRVAEGAAEKAEDEEANQAGIAHFATSKERDEAGHKALLDVAARFPKQQVGTLAALEAAALAGKMGDLAAADATYAKLYEQLPAEDTFMPVVAEHFAEAKRRAGDVTGALTALERVAKSEHRFLADEAAMERIYLLEAQGERQQAKDELEDMTLKFPDSDLQEEVRAELVILEAELPATDPAAPAAAVAPAAQTP